MKTFQELFAQYCEEYPSSKTEEHVEWKTRDKITEIAEAVNFDRRLFQEDVDAATPQPMIFPDDTVRSFIQLIVKFTETDIKLLRKGNFRDVSFETKEYLFQVFREYLVARKLDNTIIIKQLSLIDHRLRLSVQRNVQRIHSLTEKLLELCEYKLTSYLSYQDDIVATKYFADQLDEKVSYLDEVRYQFDEIRSCELYDSIDDQVTSERMEQDNKENLLYAVMEKNSDYRSLQQECHELLQKDGFVKQKKSRYLQLVKEMRAIEQKKAFEIFGEKLKRDDEITPNFPRDDAQKALSEAIKEVHENRNVVIPQLTTEDKAAINKALKNQGVTFDKHGMPDFSKWKPNKEGR